MSLGNWLKRKLGLDGVVGPGGRWISGAELDRMKQAAIEQRERRLRAEAQRESEHDQKMKDPFYAALADLKSANERTKQAEDPAAMGRLQIPMNPELILRAVKAVSSSEHLRTEKDRRDALNHLIKVVMNNKHDSEVRYRTAQVLGGLLAKSKGTAPADAIFDNWYRTTSSDSSHIEDVAAVTALGVMAANRDEAAIKVLCNLKIGGHNGVLFAELNALAATPDSRCCAKLIEELMFKGWYAERVYAALVKQVSTHGSALSPEVLRRIVAIKQAQWSDHYDDGSCTMRDINLDPLRTAATNELGRRGVSL